MPAAICEPMFRCLAVTERRTAWPPLGRAQANPSARSACSGLTRLGEFFLDTSDDGFASLIEARHLSACACRADSAPIRARAPAQGFSACRFSFFVQADMVGQPPLAECTAWAARSMSPGRTAALASAVCDLYGARRQAGFAWSD